METEYNPPQDPLVVLHEDAEVLLVDKPAGLLSVPGKGPHLADCLIARVQDAFPDALLVHRLDRDTSGVMIFALTPHAQRHLVLQVATPVAVTSYLLAEKYGADAQSVAGLVVVSTVLSVAALPLMLGFLL